MLSTPSHPDPHGKGSRGTITTSTAHSVCASEVAKHLPELAAGVAILGEDGGISSWNPQATKITGYTLEQMRNIELATLFEPQEVMRHILFKGCSGMPTPSEYLQLRHADGHLHPVAVQCAPQRQLRQNTCHLVVVFRTIDTHLDNLRQDEHLMVMGRFASLLSHEIRNQLNAVILQTDVLEDTLEDVPDDSRPLLTESVKDIRQEIMRLYEVVENFLSLARLTRLDLAPIMLATVIEAFNEEVEPILTTHGIELDQAIDTDLGEVGLHVNTFRHLWLNLIYNAVDAMPNGGTVTIRATCSDHEVHLTLADTGVGIAKDQLPLIFMPFHTNKTDGTGLGLYVVQEVAEAHHGRIEVTSQPGQGSTFTISLPKWRLDESNADMP